MILGDELGASSRKTVKVEEWQISPKVSLVLQLDQPSREDASYIWLPYPPDGQSVPEIAFEYPADAGRQSNTYPAPGLARGAPALKLVVRTERELKETVAYARAMASNSVLPEVRAQNVELGEKQPLGLSLVDAKELPTPPEPKKRREAIPRAVQREVWQRDGGRCVECETKERLCFDHIVPFSRGGSNTVRNIQLLCERCNLSKGNRI